EGEDFRVPEKSRAGPALGETTAPLSRVLAIGREAQGRPGQTQAGVDVLEHLPQRAEASLIFITRGMIRESQQAERRDISVRPQLNSEHRGVAIVPAAGTAHTVVHHALSFRDARRRSTALTPAP